MKDINIKQLGILKALYIELQQIFNNNTQEAPKHIQELLGVKYANEIITHTHYLKTVEEELVIPTLFKMKDELGLIDLVDYFDTKKQIFLNKDYFSSYKFLYEKGNQKLIIDFQKFLTEGYLQVCVRKGNDKFGRDVLNMILDRIKNFSILKGEHFTYPTLNKLDINKEKLIVDKRILDRIRNNIEYVLYTPNSKRGILLVGSPGVGKTSIIKQALSEYKDKLTIIAIDSLTSDEVLDEVFEMADKTSPTALVIEDIDILIPSRDAVNNSHLRILLNCLDGLKNYKQIITFATTNNPEFIDSALLNRPSRFDDVLTIGNYSKEEIHKLYELYIAPYHKLNEDKIKMLDKHMVFIPAFIKDIGLTIKINKITDFEEILNIIKDKTTYWNKFAPETTMFG